MRAAPLLLVALSSMLVQCAEVHSFSEEATGGAGSGGELGVGGGGGDGPLNCADGDNSGEPPTNPACDSMPIDCLLPSACEGGLCQPRSVAPDSTVCSNGRCYGGECKFEIVESCVLDECVKPIHIACTNSFTSDLSILPAILEITPREPILAGQTFAVDVAGSMRLDESILDIGQAVIPGGLSTILLTDAAATVQVRSGAEGDDVALETGEALTRQCALDRSSCDLANDQASIPGARGNTDCFPIAAFNPCGWVYDLPTSADCAPAGLCDQLGKETQCEDNGFCVTSGLPIAFDPVQGATFVADAGACAQGGAACVSDGECGENGPCAAGGPIYFGWVDSPTEQLPAIGDPALDTDGTWNMRQPSFTGVVGPIGLAIHAAGTPIQFECIMGIDRDDPDAFGAATDARPTPDSALLRFSIQVPPQSAAAPFSGTVGP